jgi:hypothetical protein
LYASVSLQLHHYHCFAHLVPWQDLEIVRISALWRGGIPGLESREATRLTTTSSVPNNMFPVYNTAHGNAEEPQPLPNQSSPIQQEQETFGGEEALLSNVPDSEV